MLICNDGVNTQHEWVKVERGGDMGLGTDKSPTPKPPTPSWKKIACRGIRPTEWDINGWGDPTIQGFGHDISINRGETIFFKIKTDSTDYRIDIYRMGYYYGGMGARRVDTIEPSVKLPQHQPDGLRDEATHLYDCGNWAVSASWQAPPDATSGIYFARLVRQDSDPASWRADNSQESPAERPLALPHAYGALGHGTSCQCAP